MALRGHAEYPEGNEELTRRILTGRFLYISHRERENIMARYANIVFMQDEEGREVVDRLCNVEGILVRGATAESITETIEYLSQWDYGTESEHDVRDEIGAGTHDTTVEEGEYVLTYNVGLGYVGLMRKVD